ATGGSARQSEQRAEANLAWDWPSAWFVSWFPTPGARPKCFVQLLSCSINNLNAFGNQARPGVSACFSGGGMVYFGVAQQTWVAFRRATAPMGNHELLATINPLGFQTI